MKRLERDLLARLHRAGAGTSGGTLISGVTLGQFFGMDVLPFAAELAKVTLMLAKELEIREAAAFGQSEDLIVTEKALPLENLDANILCADSLFGADCSVKQWTNGRDALVDESQESEANHTLQAA